MLPSFEIQTQFIVKAEQSEGWFCKCEREERYLTLSNELIAELVSFLRTLCQNNIMEICAGSGELASALRAAGVGITATDIDPSADNSHVFRASATEALSRYRPNIALGCFVPFDSGADETVMACPDVQHYIVMNARIGGQLGSDLLWNHPLWKAEYLGQLTKWMITRHDVWVGGMDHIVKRGEAWCFHRK